MKILGNVSGKQEKIHSKRVDDARRYIELYKTAMNNGYTKRANMYGLLATSILTEVYETAINEEKVKDVVSLANDMLSIFH